MSQTLPFVFDSATSLEAALNGRNRAGMQQERVLQYLKDRGAQGATDEEIAIALSMNPNTERPRRIELVEKGLVIDTKDQRVTSSGRKATVWAIKVS